MRSIFDHKQYDAANLHGSGFTLTVRFEKEINGINWEVSTEGRYYGRDYHNRDLNLKLLNNEIDSENYTYTYDIEQSGEHGYCYLTYSKGCLEVKSSHKEYEVSEAMEMTFEKACEYVNKVEKKWKKQVY